MSSVFDQYFQKFLGDDTYEFDVFREDDLDCEPEGVHRSDNWELPDRVSDFPSFPPGATIDTANPAGEMSLPETDARAG
jgi:hypothetical protein